MGIKVLYTPETFVLQCRNDKTTVEVLVKDVDPESYNLNTAGLWGLYYKKRKVLPKISIWKQIFLGETEGDNHEYIYCPTCGDRLTYREIKARPVALEPEGGQCVYCGTRFAVGDKECGECGHSL